MLTESRRLPISLDVLWLLLLGVPHSENLLPPVRNVYILTLIAYVLCDVVWRVGWWSERAMWRVKHLLLVVVLSFALVLPTMALSILRHFQDDQALIHDGAIQTEEAARFLLRGVNPYATDYTQTPMARWPWGLSEVSENPALYYYVYQPFSFLSTIPFMWLFERVLGWFDLRLLFIFTLYLSLPLFRAFTSQQATQLILISGALLNPFIHRFFIGGRSDFYVLFWVLLAVGCGLFARWSLAAIAFGLACAIKPYAWFCAPFFLLWLWPGGAWRARQTWQTWLRRVWLMPVTFGALVLPFFFWDPAAYWLATIRFPAGQTPHIYPITGYGFSTLLLSLGWIKRPTDYFPFWLPQLLFGLPAMFLMLRQQWRHNTLQYLWLGSAVLTFCLTYFTRHFDDGQIGLIVTELLLVAFSASYEAGSLRS